RVPAQARPDQQRAEAALTPPPRSTPRGCRIDSGPGRCTTTQPTGLMRGIPMTDTTTTQTSTPQTDVVMQFLTQGGATVELHQQARTVNWQYGQPGFLIGNGETRVSNGFNWRCLGCGSIGGGGRY